MSSDPAPGDAGHGDRRVPAAAAVKQELEQVLASLDFIASDRLKAFLEQAIGRPASEVSSMLAEHMRAWIADAEQHDDLTFVVVAVEFCRRGRADAYLGAVTMARILPYLICSPFAGAVLERVDLRRLVTRSAAVRCGLATATLASTRRTIPCGCTCAKWGEHHS